MLTLSLSDPIIKSILVLIGVPIMLIFISLYYKLIKKILIKFFNANQNPGYDTDTNITSLIICGFTLLFVTLFLICQN